MSNTNHTCPRRAEDGTDVEGPLAYSGPNRDTWDVREQGGLRKCSYCGSVHPDDFIERLKAGDELSPTDKNYKAYLEYTVGFNKFYYQHLSPEHRTEFIAMLNAGGIAFGFPGRFTVLPYFLRVAQ